MRGYFFKEAKTFEEEELEGDSGEDRIAVMDDQSLKTFIMDGLSRATDSLADEIFSAMKIEIGLPPELEQQYQANYQKLQFIIKNLDNLSRDQLVAIARNLASS